MSGLLGVYSLDGRDITDILYGGLKAIQHRGEVAAGASIAKNKIITHTDEGWVSSVLKNQLKFFHEISPYAASGHLLYNESNPIQPIEMRGKNHKMSSSMDGTILNHDNGEVGKLFLKHLENTDDIYESGKRFMESLYGCGSYCINMLIEEGGDIKLAVLRDPHGIKPLCLGKKDGTYIVASETCALDKVDAKLSRYIEPGEILVISKDGLDSRVLKKERHAHCMFGFIYFGSRRSKNEGVSVHSVRAKLGRMLARMYQLDIDLGGPSPDSGRGICADFLKELSKIKGRYIPYEEYAEKIPGSPRTFQIKEPGERRFDTKHKFGIIYEIVEDKDVGLTEDSIVRGGVTKDGLVADIKKAARKVIVIVSCPALHFPCFDNFNDTRAAQGLHGKPIEEINRIVAKRIGADRVCYPTTEMLKKAISLDDLCMGCVNGKYPIKQELLPEGLTSLL